MDMVVRVRYVKVIGLSFSYIYFLST